MKTKIMPIRLIAWVLSVGLLLTVLTACQVPTSTTQGNSLATGSQATDPTPSVQTPTLPDPADPVPTDPMPTDPKPTEHAPTDPAPTDPVPTDPVPTDPPADNYSWLTGTWTTVARYDEPGSISALGMYSITFNENGTGMIDEDGLTNFDIINGCLLDHWAAPGDIAFTSEEIAYTIEGDKLAITFIYHEFGGYEPFTVFFSLNRLQKDMITLTDPIGNIHDAALGGSIPDCKFVKEPISLEDLCGVLGVDYTVPPVKGEESIEIPQWLIGSWETAWRDNASYDSVPHLVTNGYVFLADGTGYSTGHEYAAWNYEFNVPGNEWESLPMGYPSTYFTYSLSSDQLTITYTRDDFEEYQPPYPTEVLTVINNADGTVTIADGNQNYVKDPASLEELCSILGVDYSIPALESSVDMEILCDTWFTVNRENLGDGLFQLQSLAIEFTNKGTGYTYVSSLHANGYAGNLKYSWENRYVDKKNNTFTYQIVGDKLYMTHKDGTQDIYVITLHNYLMMLTDTQTGETVRYAKIYSNTSKETLCNMIGVDYTNPKTLQTDDMLGSWETLWRDDSTNKYSTIHHVNFQFNEDGTGSYTQKGYAAWDFAQNIAADQWIKNPTADYHCSFTYTVNKFTLTLTCACADGAHGSSEYTLYWYGSGTAHIHAAAEVEDLPFEELCKNDGTFTQELISAIVGVPHTVDPRQSKGSVSMESLMGTWETVNRSYNDLYHWTYRFYSEGIGEKQYNGWSCKNAYGETLDSWVEDNYDSAPESFGYSLSGNVLTMYTKINSYDVRTNIYRLHLMSDGTLLRIDNHGVYTKFANTGAAMTLEELCAKLGVDYSIPTA